MIGGRQHSDMAVEAAQIGDSKWPAI